MTVFLNDSPSGELHAQLAPLGVSLGAVRQLQKAAVRRRALPEASPAISRATLERVQAAVAVPTLTLVERQVSPTDGFAKYLFRGADTDPFETVRIPLLHRSEAPKYVVCVSSQVGCAMGCAFCATARMSRRRNLSTWEMVEQVAAVQADSPHPVGGVVFMGMGEPMLNYSAVIRAARILSEPSGLAISGKAISVSTVGVIPGIRRFTEEKHPYKLVVSLTSADPQTRARLLPIEESCPLPELMEALRAYHRATRRRVTLAWVVIAGVNTREEDARQIAELTQGLPIQLDLIDVNDASGRFRPPDRAELDRFRDALSKHVGMPVIRRYSGGQDILAGCGMLAATAWYGSAATA